MTVLFTPQRQSSLKKKLQTGNTARCYFFRNYYPQQTATAHVANPEAHRELDGPQQNCVSTQTDAKTAYYSTQFNRVLQSTCTILPKSRLWITYNQHLCIALNTVRLEFRWFRPGLNTPWKSCSCRPPNSYSNHPYGFRRLTHSFVGKKK